VGAEDVADRGSRRHRRVPARISLRHRSAERRHRLRQRASAPLRIHERCGGGLLARAQERTVRVEEADGAAVVAQGRELALEPFVEGPRPVLRERGLRRRGGGACLDRCRSGLRDESERKQAYD
jgi:hypothetical protein